jgi:hypothetical protein
MSKFETLRRLKWHHRAELLEEFHALLSQDIPEDYLRWMHRRYKLTPYDLARGGVRYLGSNWRTVKEEIFNRHGSDVLTSAGLAFRARNGKTYMRFEPQMWKKVPLLIAPGRSDGFVDQLVGIVPWHDAELSGNSEYRWHFSHTKSDAGHRNLLFVDTDRLDGPVVLCGDYFRAMYLQKHGFDVACIPLFRKYNVSWSSRIAPGATVYIDSEEARRYSKELEPIHIAFAENGLQIETAEIVGGVDVVDFLRGLLPESQT